MKAIQRKALTRAIAATIAITITGPALSMTPLSEGYSEQGIEDSISHKLRNFSAGNRIKGQYIVVFDENAVRKRLPFYRYCLDRFQFDQNMIFTVFEIDLCVFDPIDDIRFRKLNSLFETFGCCFQVQLRVNRFAAKDMSEQISGIGAAEVARIELFLADTSLRFNADRLRDLKPQETLTGFEDFEFRHAVAPADITGIGKTPLRCFENDDIRLRHCRLFHGTSAKQPQANP